MSMPSFYVNPEQLVREKAEYARRNIARGRPLVATSYANGILLVAENTSATLHKISEIYDRIAFAGIGLYSEFDMLRRAGVQHADVKGYQFSREDVDARSLANLYAQYLGNVFTHEMKPFEVEILVAEAGHQPGSDQLFHILYDGTVVDETNLTVLGGDADGISDRMAGAFRDGMSLADALQAATTALAGPDRTLAPTDLEVAILVREESRRAFRRIEDPEVAELLGVRLEGNGGGTPGSPPAGSERNGSDGTPSSGNGSGGS